MIDRISPTRRPNQSCVSRQNWRDLLFLHWPVDAETLQGMIPKSLSIDLFQGKAYIGLIPFSMEKVQPPYLSSILNFNFLEVNVRTYVHYQGKDPGVYFFSLDAASWLAVKFARWFWGLPYYHAKIEMGKNRDVVRYHSLRRENSDAKFAVAYQTGNALGDSLSGTLEHFLLERYLLYSYKSGQLKKGQVHHSPYPIQSVKVLELQDGLIPATKIPVLSKLPPIAHYSSGVDVEIFPLLKVV